MKIVCENCSAKYSIADEKVAGKVFKIRCKRCDSVIVVRGDSGAAQMHSNDDDSATRVHDYENEVLWHVVIEGEQKGPMTAIQLVALFARNELDLDSYVWREGFQDWSPLRDVPDLLNLVQGDPDDNVERDIASSGASIPVGGVSFDDETIAADPFASSASENDEPFVSFDEADSSFDGSSADDEIDDAYGSDEDPFAAANAAAPAAMTGQRNENSVLFSLDNLQQLATRKSEVAPPGSTAPQSPSAAAPQKSAGEASGDASGLIDIRKLAQTSATSQVAAPVARPPEDLFTGSGTATSALGAPILAPVADEPESKTKWIVLGIGALLLVVGALGAAAYTLTRERPAVAIQAPATTAPVAADPAAAPVPDGAAPVAAAPVEEKKQNDASETPENDDSKTAKADTQKTAASTSRRDTSRTTTATKSKSSSSSASASEPSSSKRSESLDSLMNDVLGDSSNKTATKSESTSTSSSSSSSSLPDTPSRNDVMSAMNGVSGAVRNCNAGESGKAKVSVDFSGSTGRVTKAKVESAPFAGTPVGACIERAVKNARVPRFKQSSFNVKFPYSL
ncbi:MAG: GYF domain-containing protein [Polyangiales bacterium]